MQVTADTIDTIKVPLNRAPFQKFRNMNSGLAGIGLFMVLLSFASLLYSCYAVFSGFNGSGTWILNGFLCLWLVIFIGLATVAAWQLATIQTKTLSQNLPALIIDQEGIQDNASNYVFGRIPWPEIESISLASRYAPNINKTFTGVAFVLKNKDMLLQKKSKMLAMWMQADDEIKEKCQIFIPQGRISVPAEEVVRQINDFRQRQMNGSA